MIRQSYDIVIVGAGMAGATLAALLADSGLRILLAEAGHPVRYDPAEPGLRVSALSPASARILASAGAWPAIRAARVSPYRAMRVWQDSGEGDLVFDAAEHGLPELGWIVENDLVQHALLARLPAGGPVDVAHGLGLDEASSGAGGMVLRLASRRVTTRLLVGADGASSRVRALSGIDADRADYHQRAVVAVVRTEHAHQETAWQRFLPGGPVALLPLLDGRCSVVWSLPDERAAQVAAMDDAIFAAELAAATAHRLGAITQAGPRRSFPLARLHAREYVAPHLALLGDAAHVVHPLAGQGANLGLLDAAALAESVTSGVAAGLPPGAWRSLRRYARSRRTHNTLVLETLHGLHHLFGARHPALVAARGLGMRLVDAAGPLKRRLAAVAMGSGVDQL